MIITREMYNDTAEWILTVLLAEAKKAYAELLDCKQIGIKSSISNAQMKFDIINNIIENITSKSYNLN